MGLAYGEVLPPVSEAVATHQNSAYGEVLPPVSDHEEIATHQNAAYGKSLSKYYVQKYGN